MDYRIVNPLSGDKIIEAFEELLPDNYMAGARDELFIGAVDTDDVAVGILGFVDEPDRYRITYLYVAEEARRGGVATLLVDTLIGFVEETEEFKDIEADFSDITKGIREFFENNKHFFVNREYKSFCITPMEIRNSEKLKMIMSQPSSKDVGFFELKNAVRHRTVNYLAEEAGFIIHDYNYWEQHCEKDLCRCITDNKGDVDSLVLVERKGNKEYILSYLLADSPMKAMLLLKLLAERFIRDYGDCDVEITAVNESGFKLLEGIFPLVGQENNCYRASWTYF